jgi:hypothetical protein
MRLRGKPLSEWRDLCNLSTPSGVARVNKHIPIWECDFIVAHMGVGD